VTLAVVTLHRTHVFTLLYTEHTRLL